MNKIIEIPKKPIDKEEQKEYFKNLKNILLKDYENFLKDAKCLEDFNMDEIDPSGIADPEFTEYSAKAKRSLNTAGKKYFKLLQKLLKPKFSN